MRLSVTFIDNDIVKTMNELYQNKGHLHDIIRIYMLKAILYQELFTDFQKKVKIAEFTK